VPAVITGSLLPHALLLWKALTQRLGADPIATALNQLGLLALLLLLASLACTPLKIVTGWKWPLRVRKTLGLLGFFTVLGHFLVWFALDRVLALGDAAADVIERPFIAVGFAAFVLLIPLAITSTKRALKWMGPVRWQRLHRVAYLTAGLGVIHFFMRVKQDTTEPLIYGFVLAFLLLIRLLDFALRRLKRPSRGAAPERSSP
jgi:sulfoxide reductase heme-binding subunit YedZ